MKDKTNIYYIIGFVLVLIFVIILSLFFVDWYVGRSSSREKDKAGADITSPQEQIDVDMILQEVSAVERSEVGDEVVYIINGKFNNTYYTDDVLRGMFVIGGDPNNHEIEVSMASSDSKMNVGYFQDSLEGNASWKWRDVQELEQKLSENPIAQLRVRFPKGEDTEPGTMANVMRNIYTGKWEMPEFVFLRPTMVGVVVNSNE